MGQKKSERNDAKEDDDQGDPSFDDEAEHLRKGSESEYRNQKTEIRIRNVDHGCGNLPVPSNAAGILPKTALLPFVNRTLRGPPRPESHKPQFSLSRTTRNNIGCCSAAPELLAPCSSILTSDFCILISVFSSSPPLLQN